LLFEFQGVIVRHREKFTNIGIDIDGFLNRIHEETIKLRKVVEEKWVKNMAALK